MKNLAIMTLVLGSVTTAYGQSGGNGSNNPYTPTPLQTPTPPMGSTNPYTPSPAGSNPNYTPTPATYIPPQDHSVGHDPMPMKPGGRPCCMPHDPFKRAQKRFAFYSKRVDRKIDDLHKISGVITKKVMELCKLNVELKGKIEAEIKAIHDNPNLSPEAKREKIHQVFESHKAELAVERTAFEACKDAHGDTLKKYHMMRASLAHMCLDMKMPPPWHPKAPPRKAKGGPGVESTGDLQQIPLEQIMDVLTSSILADGFNANAEDESEEAMEESFTEGRHKQKMLGFDESKLFSQGCRTTKKKIEQSELLK